MIKINRLSIAFLIYLIPFQLYSQTKDCQIYINVQNEKESYRIGDTLSVSIKVELEDEICDDAGDAVKIFSKGLKIIERSDWKKISETMVGQKLLMTVIESKNSTTLTIYRKTGHYNCFREKEFNIVVPDD